MRKEKIKQYSVLALSLASVSVLSCNNSNSGIDDNPNILSRDLNLTVFDYDPTNDQNDNKLKFIDIDMNGVDDIILYIGYRITDDIKELYGYILCANVDDNDFRAEFTSYKANANIYDPYYHITENKLLNLLNPSNLTEEINNSSNTFYVAYTHISQYRSNNKITSYDKKFKGKGDKYFGFKFYANTQRHFGWMRINVANDGKSITVKELAYNKIVDAPIKIGEK